MRGQASLTAKGAATHRAVHQLLEHGAIFRDPLAVAILGEDPEAIVKEANENPDRRFMRLFVATRSRYAEERLAEAVARGFRQAVILGAGLDTFGLRNPHREAGLRVFEVDHPKTQEWKRARIGEAGLSAEAVRFAPVDFERQNFFDELAKAGFNPNVPAFFLWLGVVPYLTGEAIASTLAALAHVRAAVVFDYGEPLDSFQGPRRAYMEAFRARVAALGEPVLSALRPAETAALLRNAGFERFDDLGPHELALYLGGSSPPAPGAPGGHVVHAISTT
jgi:methyltransferase (TIGR00027 family)